MIVLFKNDYETPFRFNIRCDNKAVPIVGSKVVLNVIAKATNKRIGGGECTIVDPAQGIVEYKFKEEELSTLGEYQGRPVVELSQGARREAIAFDFEIKERP